MRKNGNHSKIKPVGFVINIIPKDIPDKHENNNSNGRKRVSLKTTYINQSKTFNSHCRKIDSPATS